MKRILFLTACITAMELGFSVLWFGSLPHKGDVLMVSLAAFIAAAFIWAYEKDKTS